MWSLFSLGYSSWWQRPADFKTQHKVPEPQRIGAKPARNNPQPNKAPTGKRKRQWR